MKPSRSFSIASDQMLIRQIKLERSGVALPGRVMFWSGRKLIGNGDIATLADRRAIPNGTDRITATDADYDDLKAWGFA